MGLSGLKSVLEISVLSFRYWDKTNCGVALTMLCISFFFPWSLLHLIVSFWAYLSSWRCYLGKNNGKNWAESVMTGVKNQDVKTLTWCVEQGFARFMDRFIISTPKLSSDNPNLWCFDYLLGIYLFSSFSSTKYSWVLGWGFFASVVPVAMLCRRVRLEAVFLTVLGFWRWTGEIFPGICLSFACTLRS